MRLDSDGRDKSRHVTDAGHDAGDHAPAEGGTTEGCGLVDDRPDTVGFHDAPDEECDAGYWDYYCL